MNADPETGVAIILNGKVLIFGGTSAVAPAMAAFVARCPKPCTVAALYKVPATCFNDITVGNNGDYQAGAGYDKCTGRGSLKGTVLASNLWTRWDRAAQEEPRGWIASA
jgi:kumamolisin